MTDLSALIERVRRLEGPDRETDADVFQLLGGDAWGKAYRRATQPSGCPHKMAIAGARRCAPTYTASLDVVVDLIERELPGWAWKVGTCCVSDDAWLVPDFNSPVHGERLKRELPFDAMKAGDLWDTGIDIDQRPSGRPAIALLLAAITAIKEKRNV